MISFPIDQPVQWKVGVFFFFFCGSYDAVKIQVYGWLWFYTPRFFFKHIYIYILCIYL